jgi:DNA-binding SARP family transcriptional activator
MQIQLRTLGTIDLRTADGLLIQSVVAQPKRLAVLVYLALAAPEGFVRRDTLTGLFWPELDQQHARAALRKTIFHLRQSLGRETVIGRGEEDLALAPGVVWCDALALDELLAEERPAEALALYRGPLLDGFFMPGTPAFESWLAAERQRVRRLAAAAAWRVAEAHESAGDSTAAIEYGRRAIALSPDDENAVRRLLSLLDRAGDSAGAFRLYEEYRHRLKAEFELQPAAETRALLERIRSSTVVMGRPPPATDASATTPDPASGAPPEAAAVPGPAAVSVARAHTGTAGEADAVSAGRGHRAKIAARVVALLAVAGVGAALVMRPGPAGTNPVLAIGHIRDYGQLDPDVAPMIRELLSTNLARVPGVQVVGSTRLYEMLAGEDGEGAAALVRAARRAGATEVVEGALYHLADGRLRFDLHRVALLTGAVSDQVSVEGSDPFDVVNAATRELAGAMRLRIPALQVADVATPSLTAFRLYEQGLRAYYLRGDSRAARPLFIAAVAEDSTFAMAAYYVSMVCDGGTPPCHDVFPRTGAADGRTRHRAGPPSHSRDLGQILG